MYKYFKKVDIEDQIIARFQDNVAAAISTLPETEIIQGRIVKNVELLAASTVKVSHKLGRVLIGWTIVRQRASSIVWDLQDANKNPNLTLDLKCSADCTVDIWVF